MSNNIFEITRQKIENKKQFVLNKTPHPACRHPKVELDIHTRTVDCAVCGKSVDTFDYMVDIARKEESMWCGYENAKLEKEIVEKSIADLKKEKRNLLTKVSKLRSELVSLELEERAVISQKQCLAKIKERLK